MEEIEQILNNLTLFNIIFGLCAVFLYVTAILFDSDYETVSVYINLYLQGILPILYGLYLILRAKSYKRLIITPLLGINCYIFYKILEIFPLSDSITIRFVRCVDILHDLAKRYNTSYIDINIYIFVIGFLLNLGLYYILSKLDR